VTGKPLNEYTNTRIPFQGLVHSGAVFTCAYGGDEMSTLPKAAVEAIQKEALKQATENLSQLDAKNIQDAWMEGYFDIEALVLAALPHIAPPAPAIAVMPLEWDDLTNAREDGPAEPTGDIEALTMIGEYSICYDAAAVEDSGDDWAWCLWSPIENLGHFGTIEAAKLVAQADYETHIRSAIEIGETK
jgi:hypothetical protein